MDNIFTDDDEVIDIYEETLSDESLEFIRNVLQPNETEWVTKYRKRVPVSEMEDAHIINTILMLERSEATEIATYPTLIAEAHKRNLSLDKVIHQSDKS